MVQIHGSGLNSWSNPAIVTDDGYLQVIGSIISDPTNHNISRNNYPHTGSSALIGGNFNGSLYPIPMSLPMSNIGSTSIVPVFKESDTSQIFTEPVFVSTSQSLAKGIRNNVEHYPRTLGENMEDSGSIIKSIDGTNTDVGQVFRLTTGVDNISTVSLVLDVSSTNDTVIDDFESYANEAALDAAWVQSDTTNSPASLETTTVAEGSQAMKILITAGKSKNDTITKTFTAQDWSTSEGLRLRFRNERSESNKEIYLQISDGTNTSEILLTSSADNIWEVLNLDFNAFTAVAATLADLTAITSIAFTNTKDKVTASYYVDKIEILTSDYGTVDVELYDFGTTANPTSLGTPVTLDDGTTKTTLTLKAGKNDYQIDLIKGITTTALTADNYYAINLTNRSLSTTTIGAYGDNLNNYYTNGFAYHSTDNSTITSLTNQDLGFQIYYNDECYTDGFDVSLDSSSGNSDFKFFIEDVSNEKINNMLVPLEFTTNKLSISHNWKQQHKIDLITPKGCKVELKYNDDISSLASQITMTSFHRFKKRVIHG